MFSILIQHGGSFSSGEKGYFLSFLDLKYTLKVDMVAHTYVISAFKGWGRRIAMLSRQLQLDAVFDQHMCFVMCLESRHEKWGENTEALG